ncbi:G-type lectin S-receptor-like serine/threonine-protein kinase LECRK3 [Camellia lanceoleosa]|uniref:G-type lectin S-receptor-like serine/threonine-protein kinase LECRK3 n=1 Tax=Camellia lanceoleosa TaxID=1840588 RepID=A0ACC0FNF5_9ERIC|nr:G-type lectin S-receptor-like serine/threonine-protein kinase LECRK3 [Camellia lanceoleosa]
MACALPHHLFFFFFFFFFFLFLLPFSTVAQTNGTVAVGTSITANTKDTPWLSPSGVFAFGFKPLQEKNLFLLSIWYHQIPDQTVVWYGNDGIPISTGSKLDLTPDRGLVLSDSQGNELWKSQFIVDSVAYGFMNDTGNFVLVRSDSFNLWESFKYPTDTMLPTQIMESGGVIFSRLSETNFSQGRFQFRLLLDGNLVLNTRDITTNFAYDAYYISGTFDPNNSSNSGYQVIFNDAGFMYILRRNNQRFDLTPQQLLFPTTEYYHRATLNFDGVFTQYYHPKSFDSSTKWTPIWSAPDNICLNINGEEGSGACGFNSICTLNEYKRPECKCPPGCFKKKLPLSNGRQDRSVNGQAFLKFRKSDLPLVRPPPPPIPKPKKKEGTLIVVGSDGKLDALVENDMEALNDWKTLERFLMVGIWCIQEDPSLRPTMRKVTQMLEGVVEVGLPPSPSQFSYTN